MVHSSYRYVTRRFPGDQSRKAPGWYVQGPGSKLLRGPFEDELQAATSIAKTLKVKVGDLLRSKVQGPLVHEQEAVSKYRFVTKRTLRGATYWMGQPNRGKQKLFKDMLQAARWTAKQRRTSVKTLLKGSALHTCRQYQLRLATVVHIYGGGSEVPGDAEFLREHAHSMEAIVEQEPAMEFLDVQGKYGPYRTSQIDIFTNSPAWSKVRRSKAWVQKLQEEYRPVLQSKLLGLQARVGEDVLLRAHGLLAVLRRTTHAVHGKDFRCWVTNCGRNVSHHSGFIPMLLRFKVLRKVPRSSVSSLDLGSTTGRRYELRSDNLLEVLSNVCELIQLADAVKKSMSTVRGPRSCSAWIKAFRDLSDVVKKNPCPGMRNVTSYLPLWTMRAILLRRMYAAGASRLQVDNSLFGDFASTFPDQMKMLDKIVGAKPELLTCKAVLKMSGYTGPPELMAMYLCFLKAVDRTSTEFLTKNMGILTKTRGDYKKQNLHNPVLRELVKIVRESLRRGSGPSLGS